MRKPHQSKSFMLAAMGIAALMTVPIITANTQMNEIPVNKISIDKEKKKRAVLNQKKNLSSNRFFSRRPFIVLNQRQQRKRWRQSPHTRRKRA